MFGYVRPSDDRLTPADRETFRAAYCGLCHALGARYGLVGRMILNYDLTFLAMVLSDGAGEMCAKRCAVIRMTLEAILKGAIPILRMRVRVVGASLVCKVDNTK